MDGDKFFRAHGMLLVIQRFSSGVMEQINESHWKWQHNLWPRGLRVTWAGVKIRVGRLGCSSLGSGVGLEEGDRDWEFPVLNPWKGKRDQGMFVALELPKPLLGCHRVPCTARQD